MTLLLHVFKHIYFVYIIYLIIKAEALLSTYILKLELFYLTKH